MIHRSAFLYMDPEPGVDDFAQCLTCRDWVRGDDLCVIHGPLVEVPGSASCGLYVFGDPQPPGTSTSTMVTGLESGLVNHKVRCENCKHFDSGFCGLFDLLNDKLPSTFTLDAYVQPKGCCNAHEPR